MSGIEIAGLVLRSFPILLSCLDHCREGFEPLEEWWNFRTHIIAFVDDIEHQMMKYNENIIRLLDPIISDNDTLTALVRNAQDPRWTDGTLDVLLEQRLASEYGRVVRIVKRMEEAMEDLKKLLRIEEDDVRWMGSEQQRPWGWHLMRIKISFSKGKTKKIKRLANHNQELQEVLGYSERIIPIADARKTSGPVALFEEIRQHACAVPLKRHWKCPNQICRPHQAYLRTGGKSAHLNVLFVLVGEQGSPLQSMKQEVMIQPAIQSSIVNRTTTPLSYVEKTSSFTAAQEQLEHISKLKDSSSFRKKFFKDPKDRPSRSGTASLTSKHRKQIRFEIPTPIITLIEPKCSHSSTVADTDVQHLSPQHAVDLCSLLRSCQDTNLGVISDDSDRQFRLSKSSVHGTEMPDTVRLVSLPELLDAYQRDEIEITRQRRFEMAVHISSALLQIQTSPWLSNRWSKYELFFLADSQTIYSDHPYVSQTFVSGITVPSKPPSDSLPIFEDDSRACLFTVGMIILELIFGCNIESCKFRPHYYGSNNQPNDQTNVSTARRWAQQVVGECGAEIADAVRRCLDCSFGPKPNFRDKRFREAVYEGVIKPLIDYSKLWPEIVP